MDTLLLQLIAPMQAWGVQSLHGERDSGLEPTKSGVIGLISAAMGLDRSEDISALANLQMGVRVDREGRLKHDFHKAEPLDARGNFKPGGKVTIGTRDYLADAAFLVGLAGERNMLETVDSALRDPVYVLFLGRKAFPPAAPVWLADGMRTGESLLEALLTFPPVARGAPIRRRFIIEDPDGEITLNDQPLSFADRRFAPRRVRVAYLEVKTEAPCTFPN